MQALILAGGKGTRLRPLTVYTPKPIVPICNRPFLLYQIDTLRRAGVTDITLSLSYQPEKIEQQLSDGSDFGVKLRYTVEPQPMGTAGAYKFAEDLIREPTVVFNGDILTDLDLKTVIRQHKDRGALATIVLAPVENPSAYGLVETDARGNVRRFLEKPNADEITCDTINAGIYVLEPDTFDRIPRDTPWSIERSFFPSLIDRAETFVAYVYRGYWIDIGTPDKYMQVHRDIMDGRYINHKAAPFVTAPGAAWVSPGARIEDGAIVEGPCFVDEGAIVKAGARVSSYSVVGRQCHIEEHAILDRAIVWANSRISQEAVVRRSILGRHCHIGRNASIEDGVVLGDKSVVTDYSRL